MDAHQVDPRDIVWEMPPRFRVTIWRGGGPTTEAIEDTFEFEVPPDGVESVLDWVRANTEATDGYDIAIVIDLPPLSRGAITVATRERFSR